MSKNSNIVILSAHTNYGDADGSIITCFDESVTLDKLLDFKQALLDAISNENSSRLIDLIYDHNSTITGLGDLVDDSYITVNSNTEIELIESAVNDIIDYILPHGGGVDITILTAKVNDNIKHI